MTNIKVEVGHEDTCLIDITYPVLMELIDKENEDTDLIVLFTAERAGTVVRTRNFSERRHQLGQYSDNCRSAEDGSTWRRFKGSLTFKQ